MLEAIHKQSGKIVSAFKIRTSLEWQGKEREEFIAPYHEIGNWDEQQKKGIEECQVTFVTRHLRYQGTEKRQVVSEHFRIITEGFLENPCNESEEHKLAKQYIYDNYENLILINYENKRISDFGEIEDIKIERGIGQKRADVLIKFKTTHEVLGRGIAFEIQISPQNSSETIIRTFDRSAQGFSVCWLWSKDLIDFKNKVKIIPFKVALKEYDEQILFQQERKLSEIAEKTIKFTEEQRQKIMSVVAINEKISEKQSNEIKSLKEEIEYFERNLKSKMQVLGESLISDKIKEQVEKFDVENKIKYFLEKKIDSLIEDKRLLFEIKNKLDNLLPYYNISNIRKEKITEKDYGTVCTSCGSKDAFIIEKDKIYCKDCIYKKSNGKG